MLELFAMSSPNARVAFQATTTGRDLASASQFILPGLATFSLKVVEEVKIHGHRFGLYLQLGTKLFEAKNSHAYNIGCQYLLAKRSVPAVNELSMLVDCKEKKG